MATTEGEEIKRTTKQKMARRHNKERGNHLEQESNSQKTMEDTDRRLHPIVDGQSLGESEKKKKKKKKNPFRKVSRLVGYWRCTSKKGHGFVIKRRH